MDDPNPYPLKNTSDMTASGETDQDGTNEDANILIITHENVGEKMAGPGIRAWEIARGLGEKDNRVILATPYASERQGKNIDIQMFTWDDPISLEKLIDRVQVVLASGPVITRVLHLFGKPIAKPTIVDIYDIAEIERILHFMLTGNPSREISPVIIDELYTYLRNGDFFVCSSERQYDFWSGALLAVGRINSKTLGTGFSIEDFIDIVPMGMPEKPPTQNKNFFRGKVPGIGENDILIYWGGGIWDWTDPFTLMDALEILLASRDDIRVIFGALHHFDTEIVPEMSAASRLMEIVRQKGWVNKYVFFGDWIPYDERDSLLLEVDIGISLNSPTIENRYAARARLMDYWWANLPCIISRGDYISELLVDLGLARDIEPGDAVSLAGAVLEILSLASGSRNESGKSVHQKSLYYWSRVIEPIHNFLMAPRKAADAEIARHHMQYVLPLRREWERIRDYNYDLIQENDQIKSMSLALQTENTNLVDDKVRLASHLDEYKAMNHALSEEQSQSKATNESLSNQLAEIQKEYDSIVVKYNELLETLEKMVANQRDLQEEQTTLNQKLEQLSSENRSLQSSNRHLRQSIVLERERLRAEVFQLESAYKHQINLYRQRKVVRLADMVAALFRRK